MTRSRRHSHGIHFFGLVFLAFTLSSPLPAASLISLWCRLKLAARARTLPPAKLPRNRYIWPRMHELVQTLGTKKVLADIDDVPVYRWADPNVAPLNDLLEKYPDQTSLSRRWENGGFVLHFDASEIQVEDGHDLNIRDEFLRKRRYLPFRHSYYPDVVLVRVISPKRRAPMERFFLVFSDEDSAWDYIGRLYAFTDRFIGFSPFTPMRFVDYGIAFGVFGEDPENP